jgi:hypothetical protein
VSRGRRRARNLLRIHGSEDAAYPTGPTRAEAKPPHRQSSVESGTRDGSDPLARLNCFSEQLRLPWVQLRDCVHLPFRANKALDPAATP